jgi:hypothetical protein
MTELDRFLSISIFTMACVLRRLDVMKKQCSGCAGP